MGTITASSSSNNSQQPDPSTPPPQEQQQDEQHEPPPPTDSVLSSSSSSTAGGERKPQKSRQRRRHLYPQMSQHDEGVDSTVKDDDNDDDSLSNSSSNGAVGGSYVPPPALFVVAGRSVTTTVPPREKYHPPTATKKVCRTKAPLQGEPSPGAVSLLSASIASSSSSSSSSSRDDQIRSKWIEMRAKDRKAKSLSLSLEKVVRSTGEWAGRYRNDDDYSSSCDGFMTRIDDASDATLKVDNCRTSSSGCALWVVEDANLRPCQQQHLFSTPIFEATLVETYPDDQDDTTTRDDPLEIMERAKVVARQELLREAVAATVVIPIGDDDDDDNDEKVDDDATSSRSSTSSSSSSTESQRHKDSSHQRTSKRHWIRVAVIVVILLLLWAAIAGAVVYFVTPKSGSSSNSTPKQPPAGGSSEAPSDVSTNSSATTSSTSSSSSTPSTVVQYGAASYEALGLSSDGSVLAIGILNEVSMGLGGVVRVMRRSDDKNKTEWVEHGIVTDDGMPYFGFAVGVSGNGQRLVVGAPGSIEIGNPDVTIPGSVRVYEYDATMNMWESPYEDWTGPSQGALFGHSVSISEDATTIVAGAPYADRVGMAQVWKINNDTRQWEQHGQALHIDVLDSHFGESTAISDDGRVLVVGGCGANANGWSGSVVPYRFDVSSDTWVAMGQPMLGNASMERWGWDVSVSGDGRVMAASANVFSSLNPGSVHVYRYVEGLNEWEPYGDVLVGQRDERFGYTVSLSHDGTTIAVGVPGEKGMGAGSVQVYAFDAFTHTWSPLLSPDVARSASSTDDLGEAVVLSSDGSFVAASSSTSGYTTLYELR